MKFGFTTKAVIESTKTIDEKLINSIAQDIQKSHDIAYDHTVSGNVVTMKPNYKLTFQRNSFWQVVKCVVSNNGSATILDISCQPMKYIYHFLTFYITFAAILEFLFIYVAVSEGMEDYFLIFIPIVLIVFSYLLAKISSVFCARAVIKIIQKHVN